MINLSNCHDQNIHTRGLLFLPSLPFYQFSVYFSFSWCFSFFLCPPPLSHFSLSLPLFLSLFLSRARPPCLFSSLRSLFVSLHLFLFLACFLPLHRPIPHCCSLSNFYWQPSSYYEIYCSKWALKRNTHNAKHIHIFGGWFLSTASILFWLLQIKTEMLANGLNSVQNVGHITAKLWNETDWKPDNFIRWVFWFFFKLYITVTSPTMRVWLPFLRLQIYIFIWLCSQFVSFIHRFFAFLLFLSTFVANVC